MIQFKNSRPQFTHLLMLYPSQINYIQLMKKSIQNYQIGNIQQALILYLDQKRIISAAIKQKIRSKYDLNDLINTFSLQLQYSQQHNKSASVNVQRIQYYQRVTVQNDAKIVLLNQKVLSLMKNIQNKESQDIQKQDQIFRLKCLIEEKEKIILNLIKKIYQSKGKLDKMEIFNKKEENQKIDPDIKQKEHIRKMNRPQPIKVESTQKLSKIYELNNFPLPSSNLDQKWLQQKKRLLKIIKEKDMKIYELIQQMHQKQKQK